MQYEDFEIHFQPEQDGVYPVEIGSPAGPGSGTFRLPIPSGTPATPPATGSLDQTRHVRTPGRLPRSEVSARRLGAELFDALFREEVKSLWDRSIGPAPRDRSSGLRIKLSIDPAARGSHALHQIPWELLFDRLRREFFALNPATPVVRSLVIPRPQAPLEVTGSLRVLVAVASPSSLSLLDWQRDSRQIVEALEASGEIEPVVLQHATRESLRRRLDEDSFHVLHFIGHGSFDSSTGEGFLWLEDEEGGPDPVGGTVLANLLRDVGSLRLLLLSACETAESTRTPDLDPFDGVAMASLMAGLPAVLAMRTAVADKAAIAFNKAFFRRLAQGDPVDRATTEGRLAMQSGRNDLAWTTPVLFLNARDGRLFERARNREPIHRFCWLHLSDLQLDAGNGYETEVVLDSLLRELEKRKDTGALQPDVVFFTGDATFSGQADQFRRAEELFQKLLAVLGLGRDRLFLVPGNHDVDRSRATIGTRAIGLSLNDRGTVRAVLDSAPDRERLLAGLATYTDFSARVSGRKQHAVDPLAWVHQIPVGPWKIAVLGLNSAWGSGFDDADPDRGLVLGEPQVRRALKLAEGADVRIALLHHPFGDLLDFERESCESLLLDSCHFVLHGCVPRARHRFETPADQAVVIAADSEPPGDARLGAYNLVELKLEDGVAEIKLRRYTDRGGGAWRPDSLRYIDAPDGSKLFEFRAPESRENEGRETATSEPETPPAADSETDQVPRAAPAPASSSRGFSDELKWHSLLQRIRQQKCTPILGPEILEPLLGSRRRLAATWASRFAYPLSPSYVEDLPQVAQFVAQEEGLGGVRDWLRTSLRGELLSRYGDSLPASLKNGSSLDQLIVGCCRGSLARSIDALAALPLPLYITAEPTSLVIEALRRTREKEPFQELCSWQERVSPDASIFDRDPDYAPSPERPLVFHLLGHLDEPESLVLTEDDYFDYLIGTHQRNRLPGAVKSKLANSALLLLGFQLDAWDLRILFRSILRQDGQALRANYSHVAVQLDPKKPFVRDPERARYYLEQILQKTSISIYWRPVEDFVEELSSRWRRETGT